MSRPETTLSQSGSTDPGSLQQSLERWRIALDDPTAIPRIEKYCATLWRHNQSLNLTRHLNYDVFVARDLNDVIQLSRLIRPGETVLDIGSGGGIPGIVLAILRPDLKVALCESVGKKIRVLESMVADLGLNCRICHQRAESLLAMERFDVCVARAIGPLWRICNWFQGRWQAMDRMLIFKGVRWNEELEEARGYPSFQQIRTRIVAEYPMPGTTSQTYLVKVWANGAPDR